MGSIKPHWQRGRYSIPLCRIFYGFIVAQLSLLLISSPCNADDRAQVTSRYTEIGNCSFALSASAKSDKLILHVRHHSKTEDSPDGKEIEYLLNHTTSQDVTDIVVVPWLSRGQSLCGVVRKVTGDQVRFFCVVFMQLIDSDGNLAPVAAMAEMYSSENAYKIMAVNGRSDGDEIIIVLGNLGARDGFKSANEGVILIDSCPAPPVDNAAVVIPWKGTVKLPKLP